MNFLRNVFGQMGKLKFSAWIFIAILFFLFYIFLCFNMTNFLVYLVVFTLPPIWIAIIIGGTIEIIEVFKRVNQADHN